ncbi:zinc finger protein OZF-like isoform X2 [Physella acuta]|uniref:zinc finger protein OZF-like isoform X2 n=1 Tax=Physella acuta TaxID=109671 RepID=UPI0027DBCABE|nr:zinc finger protein OZF-like isoform X2 [Physella acuta]
MPYTLRSRLNPSKQKPITDHFNSSTESELSINNVSIKAEDSKDNLEDLLFPPLPHFFEGGFISYFQSGNNLHLSLKFSLTKYTSGSTCCLCNAKCVGLHNMSHHLRLHTADKVYTCIECQGQFLCNEDYISHTSIHNTQLTCNICHSSFNEKCKFIAHSQTHLSEIFLACNMCYHRFKQRTDFLRHLRFHSERPYECAICPKNYIHIRSLRKHVSKLHKTDKLQVFNCAQCGKECQNAHKLRHHVKLHSKQVVLCHICGKSFKDTTSIKRHVREHSGIRPYKCEMCGWASPRLNNLSKHLNTHLKPLKCLHCDQHFSCDIFLDLHLSKHSGEKPYQCDACDKGFFFPSALAIHKRRKHSDKSKESRNHKCPICFAFFKRKFHLKRHLRVHEQKTRTCGLCPASFTDREDLKVHQATHKDEKVFQCPVCGIGFSRRKRLWDHKHIHSGVKFSCDVCNILFSHRKSLNRHMKAQHGKRNVLSKK